MLTTQLAAFQALTNTKSSVKGRGTNMKKVDDALQHYWQSIHTADAATEIALLSNLVVACTDWLKLKYEKNEFNRNKLGLLTNYYNELFTRRRHEITRLGNEALTELGIQMQAHGVATPQDLARIRFSSKKISALGAYKRERKELRKLGSAYAPERSTYLQSGKMRAIPGSGVTAVHAQLGNPAQRSNYEQQMLGGKPLDKRYVKLLNKDVERLSDSDYRLYDELARLCGMMDTSYGDMNYLKKTERLEYMVIPGVGGTLCDIRDQPITTDALVAYAMDRYGNLFIKNSDPIGQAFYFNHSSFNCGHDVIAAGIIVINNGILAKLTNESGHYKPTQENIYNCVDILAADGVNLTQATFSVWKWPGPQEHRYTADRLLSSPNALADLGVH